MAGHKWTPLQHKRFARTMRLKRRPEKPEDSVLDAYLQRPPNTIIYKGYVYRRIKPIEVIR